MSKSDKQEQLSEPLHPDSNLSRIYKINKKELTDMFEARFGAKAKDG